MAGLAWLFVRHIRGVLDEDDVESCWEYSPLGLIWVRHESLDKCCAATNTCDAAEMYPNPPTIANRDGAGTMSSA